MEAVEDVFAAIRSRLPLPLSHTIGIHTELLKHAEICHSFNIKLLKGYTL